MPLKLLIRMVGQFERVQGVISIVGGWVWEMV